MLELYKQISGEQQQITDEEFMELLLQNHEASAALTILDDLYSHAGIYHGSHETVSLIH